MALYGFQTYPVSRLKEDSAAKAASYQSRVKQHDEHEKRTHYFTHLKDLLHEEILLPPGAPSELYSRENLCNAMEKAEKRYDARVGQVVRLSLPNHRAFTLTDWMGMVREFASAAYTDPGRGVIVSIHEGRNADPRKNNPHAHLLITERAILAEGLSSHKNRDWIRKDHLMTCRKLWADVQNREYERKGLPDRVSHESNEVRGIDREPTVPLGRAAMALERKGVQTERGNRNRSIEAKNSEKEAQGRLRQSERERIREQAFERFR